MRDLQLGGDRRPTILEALDAEFHGAPARVSYGGGTRECCVCERPIVAGDTFRMSPTRHAPAHEDCIHPRVVPRPAGW